MSAFGCKADLVWLRWRDSAVVCKLMVKRFSFHRSGLSLLIL